MGPRIDETVRLVKAPPGEIEAEIDAGGWVLKTCSQYHIASFFFFVNTLSPPWRPDW
jgi:hypothetical protein